MSDYQTKDGKDAEPEKSPSFKDLLIAAFLIIGVLLLVRQLAVWFPALQPFLWEFDLPGRGQ